jgi:dTMP kinase
MNESKQKKRGKLVALCGGEGSGKSSVIQALKESNPDIVISREPGGTPYAEDIRKNMFINELAKNANADTMFGQAWAARADHMNHMILPLLGKGVDVIVDRFDCCTNAYQIHAQGGDHLEELFWHMREVYLRDKVPDLYIFLDIAPEEGLKRVAGRPGKKNHFDEQDMKFHHDVRRGYLSFFEKLQRISENGKDSGIAGKSGFIIVDASRPFTEVSSEIKGIVSNLLN